MLKQPDFIVSTIGTGGTSIAIGRAKHPKTKNVGVEPVQSPSTLMYIAGNYSTFQHTPHKLWGGGPGAASPLVQTNADTIDRVELMDWQEALAFAQWANTERGLNIGLSTGGNFVVANRLFAENPGSIVMVIVHDTPEVYRSMGL
jgi:cysteine synthase